MDELDWIKDIPCGDIHNPYAGMKWQARLSTSEPWLTDVYEIESINETSMYLNWNPSNGGGIKSGYEYLRKSYNTLLEMDGIRQIYD